MEHLHDSLSQELSSVPRASRVLATNRDDNSYSSIRPITTGVIDVKYGSSHLRNYNTDQFVDSTATSDSNGRVRPRAPIIGRRKGTRTSTSTPSTIESVGATTTFTKKNTQVHRKKSTSASISEKWDNLERFSHNNQGRALGDQDVSSLNSSSGGGIHFVNVNNLTSSDRHPYAASSNSSGPKSTGRKGETKQSYHASAAAAASTLHDPSPPSLMSSWAVDQEHEKPSPLTVAQKSTITAHTKESIGNDRIFSQVRDPIETKSGKLKSAASTAFSIPELPAGKQLIINILSTWLVIAQCAATYFV